MNENETYSKLEKDIIEYASCLNDCMESLVTQDYSLVKKCEGSMNEWLENAAIFSKSYEGAKERGTVKQEFYALNKKLDKLDGNLKKMIKNRDKLESFVYSAEGKLKDLYIGADKFDQPHLPGNKLMKLSKKEIKDTVKSFYDNLTEITDTITKATIVSTDYNAKLVYYAFGD